MSVSFRVNLQFIGEWRPISFDYPCQWLNAVLGLIERPGCQDVVASFGAKQCIDIEGQDAAAEMAAGKQRSTGSGLLHHNRIDA